MYAMQEQNRVTGKGLVFTRWVWFTNPVHAFGGIWSACFVLAVLRMTTTTLVSTWYAIIQCFALTVHVHTLQPSILSSLVRVQHLEIP